MTFIFLSYVAIYLEYENVQKHFNIYKQKKIKYFNKYF